MAHFLVPGPYGNELQPVGHVATSKPLLGDGYGVTNLVDTHRGTVVLMEGTQDECNRFIAWVMQALGSGTAVIDPKRFNRGMRSSAK